MENKAIITTLYQDYKKRAEVKSLIPMGYVPGYPVMSVVNGNLILRMPFLRYKTTGREDQTLVFPIRFVIDYSLPELSVVKFVDLSVTDSFCHVGFDRAIGVFRHEAIKDLNKEKYHAFRLQTLQKYDKLCNALVIGEEYDNNDDISFKKCLQTIIEPSLYGFYKKLDIDFYKKYIKH